MILRMQSKSAPGRDRAVEHIISEVRGAVVRVAMALTRAGVH